MCMIINSQKTAQHFAFLCTWSNIRKWEWMELTHLKGLFHYNWRRMSLYNLYLGIHLFSCQNNFLLASFFLVAQNLNIAKKNPKRSTWNLELAKRRYMHVDKVGIFFTMTHQWTWYMKSHDQFTDQWRWCVPIGGRRGRNTFYTQSKRKL